MSRLDSALALAEAGYAVFPIHAMRDGVCSCTNPLCENPAKHPMTGSGHLDATVNARTVRGWWKRWPYANIGVATGERSGIVVLDIDGVEGRKNLNNRPIPETPSVTTGRTDGGTHVYFAYPEGQDYGSRIKMEAGLDLRANGGYVIVPDSLHATGAPYRWVIAPENLEGDFPSRAPLAPLPEWLTKLFSQSRTKGQEGKDSENPKELRKGERDTGLTSEIGKLKRNGWSRESALTSALTFNANQVDPPLAEEQVIKIVDSIYSPKYQGYTGHKINFSIFDAGLGETTPTELARDAKYSDVGNAEVFIDLFGSRFRFDVDKRRWMVWADGAGVWREDTGGYAERAMMTTLRHRDAAAFTLSSDEAVKALRNWVSKSESQQGIPNALKRASNMLGMPVHSVQFDLDPELFNCQNGTLDLRTGNFYPAIPQDFISRQATVEYDPEATCPRWEAFISEVFAGNPELIGYVQRALGYSMTGLTREQAIFVNHGYGANGKSTLLNTIKRVQGDYGGATPFDTFEADSRNQYGNDLAALRGRRYVMASESEQTRKLAEARVKLVTGQDPISCRFLYGEYFDYLPQFKVWLSVNHKPIIKGTDHGIWRRIHLIPYTVTFGEGGSRPMDKELDLKLAEELPGILNWLIAGYHAWKAEGLNPPAVVLEATADYKRENDHIALWLEERGKVGGSEVVLVSDAYADFTAYLKTIGELDRAVPTLKAWSIQMSEKGYTKKRVGRGMEFTGFSLQPMQLSSRGN